MRHLLVPTDFSKTATTALSYAVALCQDLQGRITLLHVTHTEKLNESLMGLDALQYLSSALELPSTAGGFAPSFDMEELKKVAKQKLEECVESIRDQVSIETAFAEGRPSVKIVEYARDHDVDMIVMGTHGRGSVAQFFLGSVAENVVRSAACPVVTVRGKSHD